MAGEWKGKRMTPEEVEAAHQRLDAILSGGSEYEPLPFSWENRAKRRARAAARAREIAAAYVPECSCDRCQTPRAIREDFAKIARECNDGNGMTSTDIWIAYREHHRK